MIHKRIKGFSSAILLLFALILGAVQTGSAFVSHVDELLVDSALYRLFFNGIISCDNLGSNRPARDNGYPRLLISVALDCEISPDSKASLGGNNLREELFYWQQGYHAFNLDDLPEAAKAWRNSLTLSELMKKILLEDGNELEATGLAISAEKHYRALALLDPQAWRYEYLGDYYLRSGRVEEAISAFREGQAISNRAENYYLEARAMEVKNEWQKAAENYRSTISFDPDHAIAYFRLAQIEYLRLAQEDKAFEDCEMSIQADPTYYACYELLGNMFQARGLVDKAIFWYQAGINHVGGAHKLGYQSMFYYKIGDVFLGTGDNETAKSYFENALEVSLYNGDAHRGLALLSAAQGDISSAIESMNNAISGQRAKGLNIPVEWYLELGNYYELDSDSINAISIYQMAISHYPGNPKALERLDALTHVQQ